MPSPWLIPNADTPATAFFHSQNFGGNRDHRNYIPRSRRSQGSARETRFNPDYSRDTSSFPRETPEQAAARRAEETARAKERMKQQRENGTLLATIS